LDQNFQNFMGGGANPSRPPTNSGRTLGRSSELQMGPVNFKLYWLVIMKDLIGYYFSLSIFVTRKYFSNGIKPNERRRMPVEKCWPDWPDGPLSIHFNWPVHNFTGHWPAPKGIPVLYPRNDVVGGYTGFTMSVCRQILCHTIT
jgi:hypothetical protein